MFRSFRPAAAIIVALAVSAVAAPAAVAAPTSAPPGQASKLTKGVTIGGIMEHLQAFQAIADANGGTRAAGTPGYDASVDYVVQRLEAAGYDPVIQTFDFPYYEKVGPSSFARTAPTPTTFVEGVDFDTIDYSGSGTVTGTVQAVDLSLANPGASTSGCEDADFAGFTAGNIALLQRGTCTFETKIQNATEAGATGAVIFNQGTPDRLGLLTTVTASSPRAIPVVTTSFALGEQLAAPGTVVAITTNTISEIREVANVIADTPTGNDSKVVVVGAHLDSVVEGPGINDNGSGSGAILEVAETMAAKNIKPRNTIRFAWWGAEEAGLVGSEFYVASLSEDELDDIALNLNFDMLGSTNYARMVYDGDGDETGIVGPPGSAQIEQVFLDYFEPRARHVADGVQRPLGLRAVHRRGHRHSRRWTVLGRRGAQDPGAVRAVRRHRRRAARPLLPRGVRHDRQRQPDDPRPDGRRRGVRNRDVRLRQGAGDAGHLEAGQGQVPRRKLRPQGAEPHQVGRA